MLFNLAVEQYSSGQFALALATIQSLRALNDSAELEDLAGDTQEQTGDRESAVRSHQNAIALAPKEERYRLSLGAELLKFGDYERAASVFEQGAQLFPNSARIYVGLGMSYYFVEKYDESGRARRDLCSCRLRQSRAKDDNLVWRVAAAQSGTG